MAAFYEERDAVEDRAEDGADEGHDRVGHVEYLHRRQVFEDGEDQGEIQGGQGGVDDELQMQLLVGKEQQGGVQHHHGDPALDVAAGGVVEQHGDTGDAAGDDARGPVEPEDGQGLAGDRQQGDEAVAELPPQEQLFSGLADLGRAILFLEYAHGCSISKKREKSTFFPRFSVVYLLKYFFGRPL